MEKKIEKNEPVVTFTVKKGTPQQEFKSTVIKLDSPQALEKIWVSDGIEVKNKSGAIETRGRFESPVSLREINVALVAAYSEHQGWPEIAESLDKSRDGKIAAVWIDQPGKTATLRKVIAVDKVCVGAGDWKLWKERFFLRHLLRLKNPACVLNPRRKDYRQQLRNFSGFVEELSLDDVYSCIKNNDVMTTLKNFERLMRSKAKEPCCDCRYVAVGKDSLWTSMLGVWGAQTRINQKYSLVILEGVFPDIFALVQEHFEKKYGRKISLAFTVSTRTVFNKVKKYGILMGLYLLNNDNIIKAMSSLTAAEGKEIVTQAVKNEIRRQASQRRKKRNVQKATEN